jgi:periplasmic divalent cation tolerance protein
MRERCGMFIAWTTLATRADADRLAAEVVALGLAACAQVEGPIISHYLWQGKTERTEEFRLCLKCLPDKLAALEIHVLSHHPYATPEWLVVRAERVGEKYLSWAGSNATKSPL